MTPASRFLFIAAIGLATASQAAGLKPGQFAIQGQNVTQQICVVSDGTWYGSTFNWSGRWSMEGGVWQLNGNYAVGDQYYGYGNSSMQLAGGAVKWYDWYDDASYQHYEVAPFAHVKTKCDPPYTGANTQAVSQ